MAEVPVKITADVSAYWQAINRLPPSRTTYRRRSDRARRWLRRFGR